MGTFLSALLVTLALVGATVYFVQVLWPLLPPWLSLIVFILLAVMVIGYPIYSLGRWSNQRFERQLKTQGKPKVKPQPYDDEDDWQ